MGKQTPRQLAKELLELQRYIRLYSLDRQYRFAHLSDEQLSYIPKSQDHLKLEIELDQIRAKLAELQGK